MTIDDSNTFVPQSPPSSNPSSPRNELGDDLDQLQRLGDLIQSSIQQYVKGKRQSSNAPSTSDAPPPHAVFDAQRNLLAAAGKLTELVAEPGTRLQETSIQYMESRALQIVADARVPDKLAASDGGHGTHIDVLARETNIESRKLVRLLRVLCTNGIFHETSPDYFANNRISAGLVGNEPLRAYILHLGCTMMTAAMQLPRALTDATLGPSYSSVEAPFQVAMGTEKDYWGWMEESLSVRDLKDGRVGKYYTGVWGAELDAAVKGRADGETVPRPELGMFSMAMQGNGRVASRAHYHDFPWQQLGDAVVVDVGGGIGSFCMELARLYPSLRFVVQDRAPVLEQAEQVWQETTPSALAAGRVSFQEADFFEENQVKGADVYWLRLILHDWPDEDCVRILSAIRSVMAPHSRILLGDHLMITTAAQPGNGVPQAPSPLPANWGNFRKYSNCLDLGMMCCFNGQERTPADIDQLTRRAGLKIRAVHDIRSYLGLIEVVLADD